MDIINGRYIYTLAVTNWYSLHLTQYDTNTLVLAWLKFPWVH